MSSRYHFGNLIKEGHSKVTQVLTLGTQLKQGHLDAIQGEQGQLGSSWVVPGGPKV